MGFHSRRSIKLHPRSRPGSGLRDMHAATSRVVGFVALAPSPSHDSDALPGRDWRGLMWIALVASAIAAAAVAAQAMK